jgi:hypothetical protein
MQRGFSPLLGRGLGSAKHIRVFDQFAEPDQAGLNVEHELQAQADFVQKRVKGVDCGRDVCSRNLLIRNTPFVETIDSAGTVDSGCVLSSMSASPGRTLCAGHNARDASDKKIIGG